MIKRIYSKIVFLGFILLLCFSSFADSPDAHLNEEVTMYEWYKEGDNWRCKRCGKDIVDKREQIGIYTYWFDENGNAKGNCKVKAINEDCYFLYDGDINPVANEYVKLYSKLYKTNKYGILEESNKGYVEGLYLELDSVNNAVEKARECREEVRKNLEKFNTLLKENDTKNKKLVFEKYELSDVIWNADDTITDIRTGELIKSKAIDCGCINSDGNPSSRKIYLDENGKITKGYLLYYETLYKFNDDGIFYKTITSKKEIDRILEEERKKNGYHLVQDVGKANKVTVDIENPVGDNSVQNDASEDWFHEVAEPIAHE